MITGRIKKSNKTLKNLEKEVGPTSVGRLLKHYRSSMNLTQAEMGEKLGIAKQHICDLEKGRRLISVEMASKIAKKLKEPVNYWVVVALQDQVSKANLSYKVKLEEAV